MADAPLDVNYDLSQAKTVVPMIAAGTLCRLRLNNLTVSQTDKGPTTKWEWKVSEPVPESEGGTIRPGDYGSTFFENIQMYSKAGSKKPDWFVERIAKRVDGLLGTGDPGNKKGKPARPAIQVSADGMTQIAPTLIGKEIVAKMKVRNDDDYVGNEIGTITFPGDISA